MVYTVKKLAGLAGVSVRTLHYYDQIGLLKPASYSPKGYRYYGDDAALRLQQVLYFRELGFGLGEIQRIISRPDFDVLEALESHRTLLSKKAERLGELLKTVEKTVRQLREGGHMSIKDYYQGFSDEQVEALRDEARKRWGVKTIEDSEKRVLKMGKQEFDRLQAEGDKIFQALADNMAEGPRSPAVQKLIGDWREWLENFAHYSDEAVLGLGQAYSQDARFAAFFEKYDKGLPAFFAEAVEFYSGHPLRSVSTDEKAPGSC